MQLIKLVEEVGELAAEQIARDGFTYKDFDRENLYSEMSDVIIMIFAYFFKVAEEDGFDFDELVKMLHKKIDKWDGKLEKKAYRYFKGT